MRTTKRPDVQCDQLTGELFWDDDGAKMTAEMAQAFLPGGMVVTGGWDSVRGCYCVYASEWPDDPFTDDVRRVATLDEAVAAFEELAKLHTPISLSEALSHQQ